MSSYTNPSTLGYPTNTGYTNPLYAGGGSTFPVANTNTYISPHGFAPMGGGSAQTIFGTGELRPGWNDNLTSADGPIVEYTNVPAPPVFYAPSPVPGGQPVPTTSVLTSQTSSAQLSAYRQQLATDQAQLGQVRTGSLADTLVQNAGPQGQTEPLSQYLEEQITFLQLQIATLGG